MIITQTTIEEIYKRLQDIELSTKSVRLLMSNLEGEKKLSKYTNQELVQELNKRLGIVIADDFREPLIVKVNPEEIVAVPAVKSEYTNGLSWKDRMEINESNRKTVVSVFGTTNPKEVSDPRTITFPIGEIHRSPGFVYRKDGEGFVFTNGTYRKGGFARVSNDSDGWRLIDKWKKQGQSFRYIYRCPRIAYKLARAGACGVKKKYAKVVDVYSK
jgi:hypothetical protein